MKLTLLEMNTEKGTRLYYRDDKTFWEIRKDTEYNVYSIWQIDPIRDEIIFNDPRNGIEGDSSFAPRISDAIECIKQNRALF